MADLHLVYSAISDVGRVRKDNQDSGYAGPWLLAVADGVGGAARGDVASAAAIQQIRKLDEQPTEDLLAQVAGALHRAHDRIGELVDQDPALNGTSTTAVVALFDGTRLGMGHVGDSRAYLLRAGHPAAAHHRPHVRADAHRRRPDHRGRGAHPPAPQPDPQGHRQRARGRARPVPRRPRGGRPGAAVQRRHPLPHRRPDRRHHGLGLRRLRRGRAGPGRARGRLPRQRHLHRRRRRGSRPAGARRPGPAPGRRGRRPAPARAQQPGDERPLPRPPRRRHRRARARAGRDPQRRRVRHRRRPPDRPRGRPLRTAAPERYVWARRLLVAAILVGPALGRGRRGLVVEPAAVLRRRRHR